MQHNQGLTMVEALVLMFVVVLLVAIFLPVMGTSHRIPPRMLNNTQMRGIHQSMVMYAQDNARHFPGLDRTGQPTAIDVEDRFKMLLGGNYFTPEYLIHPGETANKQPWHSGPFTSNHYSHALLQVSTAGGRHDEWFETLNPDAIVMADRNTGTPAAPMSIRTSRPGDWEGGIVRNDNSVTFETTHLLDTDYAGHAHLDDHLFEAASDNDAYLIHSGN